MKHNVYEYCLFLKILHFLFKGSLNIPEYRCLLIGRAQYSVTLLSLVYIVHTLYKKNLTCQYMGNKICIVLKIIPRICQQHISNFLTILPVCNVMEIGLVYWSEKKVTGSLT